MARVTIVKNYRNMETLKGIELTEIVRLIQSCEYDEAVMNVMGISLYTELKRQDDGSMWGATMMPQTLLAFIGASGRSVKIVCRGELFGGGLPVEEEDIKRFHLNLYEKARMVYNAQLGLCPSTYH